jgi:hypothetical protein
MYKLSLNVTQEMLEQQGFSYRKHYDNYILLFRQPDTTQELEEAMKLGYSQEEAEKQYAVKRTYIDYAITTDLNTREVDVFTHALIGFPYEETLNQHDISHTLIDRLVQLVNANIFVWQFPEE